MNVAGGARRTITSIAAPSTLASVVFAVMVVNMFARSQLWQREWFWAAYQYHFGLILCGPVVAGLGAWRGRAAGRGRWLMASAGDRRAPLLIICGSLLGVVAGYLAGALPVALRVAASGSPDRPALHVAMSFVPALAALCGYLVMGIAIGARWPIRVIAPVAMIAAFGATMLGWIAGVEAVVRLGGATMTLEGLRPSPSVQIGQTVFYAALAAGATAWCVGRLAGTRHGRLPRRLCAAVVVAVGGWLAVGAGQVLVPTTARTSCVTVDAQRFCALRPYGDEVGRVARRLGPPVQRLRDVGVAVPETVDLGQSVDLFDGRLTPSKIQGELYALVDVGRCVEEGLAYEDVLDISRWLALVSGDASQDDGIDDPDVPAPLTSGDRATEDQWARHALRRIRASCP